MKRADTTRNLELSLKAGAFTAPAYARTGGDVSFAPPAAHYEAVPAIAPGHTWAPGYWDWNGERHVWVRGRAIVQRDGYLWAPDRWKQNDGNYHRTAGHWKLERHGD